VLVVVLVVALVFFGTLTGACFKVELCRVRPFMAEEGELAR
jgi:hypothetical protein